MVEIKLSEEEKKVIEKFYRQIEEYQLDPYHLMDRAWEGKDWDELNEIRKKLLKILFNKVLKIIRNNPGILQVSLYEGFFGRGLYRSALSMFLNIAEKKGIIIRIKQKNSYKLYLSAELTTGEIFKKWEKVKIYKQPYPYTVRVEYCKDLFDEVLEYFGEINLIKMYQIWHDIVIDFMDIYYWDPSLKIIPSLDKVKNPKKSLMNFLGNICNEGATLKLEMNKPLIEIINKYWTEECNVELKKFLSKYGFFADKVFVDLKLKKLMGENNFLKFHYELKKNSKLFKIRLCYKYSKHYHYKSKLIVTAIPYLYAESLKYKWMLKPKIIIKKCKYCGKEFIPIFPNYWNKNIENIVKYYPIKKSINEINFCYIHFPPLSSWEEDSTRFLKKLIKLIGFIPPENLHEDYSYLKGLNRQKFEKAIILLNHLPSYSKIIKGVPLNGKKYNSWVELLMDVGILKKDSVLKTARGYRCIAEDGHLCCSLGEKNIDDWLYSNGIPHEREVRYPGSRAFRADWKVGEYFIEYWGLKGQEDYDEKMEIKKKIAQKYGIPLISITPTELPFLDSKLKKLKDEYGGKELPIYESKSLKRKRKKEILIELDKHTLELMKIPGMGYTKIKRLNEAGIHSLDDIRNCSFENLLRIEGFGDELIKRLLAMVGREEECYLFELKKIPMVWNETIIKLSKAGITSIDQLSEYTVEELVRIAGIGIGAARKIKEYIESKFKY